MTALALGLIAAFAWGFHDVCVRYVSQKTPLMAALLTVLVVGLAFHVSVMLFNDGFTVLNRRSLWLSAASGVFFLVASLGLYGAFQRGPVRLVAPIIAGFPILSVGGAALTGTPVSVLQWAAVLAIVAGISVVAALADTSAQDTPPKPLTIVYALIAAVGFAGTFALGQEAAAASSSLPVTLVTRVTAILLLLCVILAWKLPIWPGRSALPVLGLMGVADGIALLCVLAAGGMPDAQYAAVAASIFGLLTIVMARVFLREVMTMPQWVGCAVAFCGIGYLAW